MIFIIAAVAMCIGVAIGLITGAVMRERSADDAYSEGLRDGKRLMARWEYDGARRGQL